MQTVQEKVGQEVSRNRKEPSQAAAAPGEAVVSGERKSLEDGEATVGLPSWPIPTDGERRELALKNAIPIELIDECKENSIDLLKLDTSKLPYLLVVKTIPKLEQELKESKQRKEEEDARNRKRVLDYCKKRGIAPTDALSALPIEEKDKFVELDRTLSYIDELYPNGQAATATWIIDNTNFTRNEVALLRKYLAVNGLFWPDADSYFWGALNHIMAGPRIEAFSARAVEEAIRQAALYRRRKHPDIALRLYQSLQLMRARRQQGDLQVKMRALDLVVCRLPGGTTAEGAVLLQSQPKPKRLPAPKQKQLSEAARKQTP